MQHSALCGPLGTPEGKLYMLLLNVNASWTLYNIALTISNFLTRILLWLAFSSQQDALGIYPSWLTVDKFKSGSLSKWVNIHKDLRAGCYMSFGDFDKYKSTFPEV